MEKFIRWMPGNEEQMSEEEKQWFEDRPLHEPKFTAWFRCGFLNYLEDERFTKIFKIVDGVLIRRADGTEALKNKECYEN